MPGNQFNNSSTTSLHIIKKQLIVIYDFHILQADTITIRTHATEESGL
jgi:hypothetical protein